MSLEPDSRRDTISQIFSSVNDENYEGVVNALDGYQSAIRKDERDTQEEDAKEQHLKGWLLGLAIGAVVGSLVTCMIVWLAT